MAWLEATFEVQAEAAEALADALLEQGALSVEVDDADAGTPHERPLFGEPGEAPTARWPRQRLKVLLSDAADAPGAISLACATLDIEPPAHTQLARVAEQDWVRLTQQQFTPVRVGARLWVVPTWCAPPDPDAVNLTLDPGLAFGTGTHPTTQQCLAWLESNLPRGTAVLDYGCGSGVLAIAAKRLGAGRVVAVDIDPAALQVARANAAANRVEVAVVSTGAVPPGPYGVILANILASPLVLLAPLLAGFGVHGSYVVLAGILTSQADAVAAAYAPWFEMALVSEAQGWTCLAGVRKQ